MTPVVLLYTLTKTFISRIRLYTTQPPDKENKKIRVAHGRNHIRFCTQTLICHAVLYISRDKMNTKKSEINLARFYLRAIMRKEGFSEIEIAETLKGVEK